MPRFTKTQVIIRSLAMSILIGLMIFAPTYLLLYGKLSLIKSDVYKIDGLTVGDISCSIKSLRLSNGAAFLSSSRLCNIITSEKDHSVPIDVTVYRATSSNETMIRTLYVDGYAIISEEASEEQRWVVVLVSSIPFVMNIGAMIFIFIIGVRDLASQ